MAYNKYRNHRCEYGGLKFASERERNRYIYLRSLERKGEIKDLRFQVPFQLLEDEYTDNIVHLKTKDKIVKKKTFTGIKYVADFVYQRSVDGKIVVEDTKSSLNTKGAIDKVFELKEKMMHSILHIDIHKIDNATASI